MNWKFWIIRGAVLLFLLGGAVMDLRSRTLRAEFLFGFIGVGGLMNIFWHYQSPQSILAGALPGILILLIGKFTKESIGYGDGLGILAVGVFVGARSCLLILTGAFLFSAVYGLVSLLTKRKKSSDTIAFFPFLFAAALGGVFL